jgi:hypothetical protein
VVLPHVCLLLFPSRRRVSATQYICSFSLT